MINYWLKLIFSTEGLAPLVLTDSFQSEWKQLVVKEIHQIGFSNSILKEMGYINAKAAVKRRIWDIELQEHVSLLGNHSGVTYNEFTIPRYLTGSMPPKIIRAFTLARLNVLPSKLLDGKFQNIPLLNCLCPCEMN
ncbi:hypothetical protein JRQ81_016231 [Phrynocephalus forsythii]|uniref:Uncharacterized protein n=1 Tax=Phrynocephalus forsythii TaxID=171643 RepID=A0A9Q0XY21_9SAUR|nr:hypothetical protein JRQ81_016231 [Phrynocephalus forsythii]